MSTFPDLPGLRLRPPNRVTTLLRLQEPPWSV